MNKITIEELVHDPEKYGSNSCSEHAKKFHDYSHNLEIELWLDKHCGYRQTERYGIELENLQDLVINSLKHILYYQLRYPKINLIQYPEYRGRNYRIAVQTIIENGDILNIVVEYHYVDICIYELTIITAMVVNDFKHFDGQYILDIDGESSRLLRKVSNVTSELHNFGYS